MSTVIDVQSVTRYYNDFLAVDDISFQVNSGEIFGFLGPNGAGKTTTQRILTGVLEPSSGTVRVLDHDMVKDPLGAKEHVGVVPEVANPYMEMTGLQNMAFAGELYGVPKADRRRETQTLLESFALWDRRNDSTKSYSKGMRQRLIISMALLHRPQVLFLDEPTAGLDVASRRIIHQRVRTLAEEGTAVFYTTHNIEEANTLCDRVAIICRGNLAAIDTPEALKSAFAESQAVQVAFDRFAEPEEFDDLEAVQHVEPEGDKLRLYTASPGAVVEQVVDFARSTKRKVITLNTLAPSLEEVFVRLTEQDDQ